MVAALGTAQNVKLKHLDLQETSSVDIVNILCLKSIDIYAISNVLYTLREVCDMFDTLSASG